MDYHTFILLLNLMYCHARFCEKTKAPFELGKWRGYLRQLDSATIENKPVSVNEGQVYVYENTFPGYTIRYVTVDNLAQKTCGASASLTRGGIGTSTILLVLHAASHQEIRSVIDVWGTKDLEKKTIKPPPPEDETFKSLKSRYLFKEMRAVNHNTRFVV